jgi:putative salt-induced outer membrane protein YdiY
MLLLIAAAAAADTLILANGDRISGTLRALDPAAATIATDYAGELTIQRDAIAGLATDSAVYVLFTDGEEWHGRLGYDEQGLFVDTDEGAFAIDLADVEAVARQSLTAPPPPPPAPAGEPWTGSVSAGMTLRSGGTDTLDAALEVSAVRKWTDRTLTLSALGSYGEVESEATARRLKGAAKLQLYPRDRLYYFIAAGAEHDAGRALDLRLNASGGIGYDFITGETRSLSAEIGLDVAWERQQAFNLVQERQERERIRRRNLDRLEAFLRTLRSGLGPITLEDIADGLAILEDTLRGFENETDEEDFLNLYLSARYEQQVFEQSRVTNALTLYPQLDDVGEVRAFNELAFTTPLSEQLSLKLSLNSEYDTDPPNEQNEWDHTFISALRYTW